MRLMLATVLAATLLVCAFAQEAPLFPPSAAGFDDGRAALLKDASAAPFPAAKLSERIFEHADLFELAAFCTGHLTLAERTALDEALGTKGALRDARTTPAAHKAMLESKLAAASVAAEIGKLSAPQSAKLEAAIAWHYRRGLNCRILQAAFNGERIDSMRLRALLRTMQAAGKGDDEVFTAAHWDFNLADARDHKGGHYDGTQLVESLLDLGWNEAAFAAALKKYLPRGLSADQQALLKWGDAALAWQALSLGVSEAELYRAGRDHYKANKDPRVFQTALRRASAGDRWLRTGGAGVIGVWAGPLPDPAGEPKPPATEDLAEADYEAFARAPKAALARHFETRADRLFVVGYADGSARMIVDRPGRPKVRYAPDTPIAGESSMQLYEGRFSPEGRMAFAELAFAADRPLAPGSVSLVNVRRHAQGALLAADLDDGVTLTPVLLRRVSRLVEAP